MSRLAPMVRRGASWLVAMYLLAQVLPAQIEELRAAWRELIEAARE